MRGRAEQQCGDSRSRLHLCVLSKRRWHLPDVVSDAVATTLLSCVGGRALFGMLFIMLGSAVGT